jgi:LysR family glycine cleavage system transcriptional activator
MAEYPAPDPALDIEKLMTLSLVPVCSLSFLKRHGPLNTAEHLARVPLIHDETFLPRARVPTWTDWFHAAGVDHVDVPRGLTFNTADHALDAASEGAGVLLAQNILAYDHLRSGRLVIPVTLALPSGRAYHLVRPKRGGERPQVEAFGRWLKDEFAALDWTILDALTQNTAPRKSPSWGPSIGPPSDLPP